MSSEKNDRKTTHDVFDIEKLRQLMELMKVNDVSEVDLRQDYVRIQLRRSVDNAGMPATSPPIAAAPVSVVSSSVSPTIVSNSPVDSVSDDSFVKTINSPMVGTFYASANPDSPAYVKVGDSISPDKTVCIVEAMKVFNEIQAEMSGKIIAILVKNGDAVEFGKPLFKVDTRG
ncbi:MAG: acetyl-CoA carboxylase biotin carboxyl carrier protein [Planctomycetia bacterium]|nr:acetyl-CoA carboxylase biotin carboxyl carrier protein [Planctomycetia bacterium]